jgi:hypothetical protein
MACEFGNEAKHEAGNVEAEDEYQHWPPSLRHITKVLPFNSCRHATYFVNFESK